MVCSIGYFIRIYFQTFVYLEVKFHLKKEESKTKIEEGKKELSKCSSE